MGTLSDGSVPAYFAVPRVFHHEQKRLLARAFLQSRGYRRANEVRGNEVAFDLRSKSFCGYYITLLKKMELFLFFNVKKSESR